MTQSHKEVKELHDTLSYVEASMSIMMKDKVGILPLVYVYQMRKEKMQFIERSEFKQDKRERDTLFKQIVYKNNPDSPYPLPSQASS